MLGFGFGLGFGLDRTRPGHLDPGADFFRLGLVVNDFGLDAHVGSVRHLIAQGFEAIEILNGAAVLAFRLSAVAEHQADRIGLLRDAAEAFGDAVIAVLSAGDFDIAAADHVGIHRDDGVVASVDDVVHGAREHAGIETRAPEHHLLGEGDALDRDEFLGVHRLIAGDGVGSEPVDFGEVFETHDGEGRRAEIVMNGEGIRHAKCCPIRELTSETSGAATSFSLVIGNKGKYFENAA
jgi:hypothetical protein